MTAISTISLGELTAIVQAANEMREVFGVLENIATTQDKMMHTAQHAGNLSKFCQAYNKLQDNVRGLKMIEFTLAHKE